MEGKGLFSLSPLQPQDVREISRVLASMDPWLTLGYKPEALAFYLLRTDPALQRFAIIISGEISGVLAVRFPWLFGPFIELIALFDGFRGKGIGHQLVDAVAALFDPPNLWATVSSFNLDAQRFYSRVGFKQATFLEDLIKPGWHEILLRKRLKTAG